MNLRTPLLGALALAVVMTGFASDGVSAVEDPYADLRGILLDGLELEPRAVQVDGFPGLPASGLAYRLVPMTESSVRALAEDHAGRPVEPGLLGSAQPQGRGEFRRR
ncbi:MAG: hypothetical protein H0V10_14510 [Geodermatophilaceae bacterium]|nr:hypothetical protein [Geodermatophilaceae bacterium]